MNKITHIIIILLFVFITEIYADNINNDKNMCLSLFKKYELFPEIKSLKGWKRVQYNNRLKYYIIDYKSITDHEAEEIYFCLFKHSHNIQILSRTIGGEL